jgi:hypothetical protein
VGVVGHQAVRKNLELLDRSRTTKLLQGPCRDLGIREGFQTFVRAKRQKVAGAAYVVHRRKALWSGHDD